jgi:cystathionine gamma-synthase
MSADARAAAGIGDGLLRLSVGIEALADLSADLQAALQRAELTLPRARCEELA